MNKSSRALPFALASLAVLLVAAPLTGADAVKKIALVTIPAELQLKTSPEKVWSVLVTREGFSALTGIKMTGELSSFSQVGDHVSAEVGGDKGHLFVTAFLPPTELRVNFEPEGGHYFCQQRIKLSPWSGGTTLSLTERYTDEKSGAEDTAKRVAAELRDSTRTFPKLVEQP
ncbi:MAG: hypothetical protein ACM3SU_14120 [Acidobacteriota bacterium]